MMYQPGVSKGWVAVGELRGWAAESAQGFRAAGRPATRSLGINMNVRSGFYLFGL